MKLTIVSDLHVDVNKNYPLPHMEGNILIVAGDTANSSKIEAQAINQLSQDFDHVLVVDGNHTHYSNNFYKAGKIDTIANNNQYFKSLLASNVIKLDQHTNFQYNSYCFIGCNGWYSMNADGRNARDNYDFWKSYMNDYKYIWERGSRTQPYPDHLAQNEADGLENQIIHNINDGLTTIVVTHTVPCVSNLDDRPWDIEWQRAHSFYYNSFNHDLIDQYSEYIPYWFHGHTHARQDNMVNSTRVIANPRGYPNENQGWFPLEIEL